jgi:hypothetical protein
MSALQPQCHRTIIHELDVHHRPEFAGLDSQLFRSQCENECFIERNRDIRSSRIDKTRPSSLLRIPVKSELRYDENLSSDIGEREVHLVLSVSKKTEAGDFVGHPLDLRERVGCGEADEYQKSTSDFSGGPLADANFRTRDALKQYAQALLDRD